MGAGPPSDAEAAAAGAAAVDETTAAWRQGDVLDGARFVHLADSSNPTVEASHKAATVARTPGKLIAVTTAVEALVVVSQTCDVVRPCSERPFLKVSPLVRLVGSEMKHAAAGDMPRYAALPNLGDDAFADLDRVETVEKAAACRWSCTAGLVTDEQRARFAAAVARNVGRYAFPDELAWSLAPLADAIKSKYGKRFSPEGAVLRNVEEIRVAASPRWDAEKIEVEVLFVFKKGHLPRFAEPPIADPDTKKWLAAKVRRPSDLADRLSFDIDEETWLCLLHALVQSWIDRCVPVGPITAITYDLVNIDEVTLDRIRDTQKLDLDHFSEKDIPSR